MDESLLPRILDTDPPAVVDPLAWLEGDDPEVRTWLAGQRRRADDFLAGLPGSADAVRDACRKDRAQAWASVPLDRGGYWFFHARPEGAERVALHVSTSMLDIGRPLLRPQDFDGHRGLASLGAHYPSPDGRHLIASVQRGGSEATELVLVSVPDGAILDRIDTPAAAFAVWHDRASFFVSRDAGGRAALILRQLDGGETELSFPADTAGARLVPITSDDLRWLLVSLHAPDLPGPRIFLAANATTPRFHEVTGLDTARLRMAWWGPRGPILIERRKGAPAQVLVADLTGGAPSLRPLHTDDTGVLVTGVAAPSGDVLLCLRGQAGGDRFRHLAPDGSVEDVPFEDGASIVESTIERGRGVMLAQVLSWTRTAHLVEYDFAARRFSVLRKPKSSLDIAVEQRSFTAEDGTPIPVTVLRPPNAAPGAPCLVTAYGAFGASLRPWCLTVFKPWFDAGGMVAHAHVRGGGEGGPGWHEAARGAGAKMTSFIDLIAVCRGLAPHPLCLYGIGAGGMLVLGAAVMAPDICAGLIADGPLADMANYHRWGNGPWWMREFGDPAAELAAIGRWSPLHNLNAGTAYPPMLVISGTDDRAETPVHGRKMVAALQAAGAQAVLHEIAGIGNRGAVTLTAQSDDWALIQRFAAGVTRLPLAPQARGV